MIRQIRERHKRAGTPDALAIPALFFCSIAFFVDLFDGRYLLTERDLSLYFIPPRFFWVGSITSGEFPLWNPLQFCGHPFFANPQNAVLYPLNSLFLLLPFDIAFNGVIVLHFFLGGLFTYLLLKDMEAGPTAALLSAFVFMLGGYLLSVHSLLTILLSSIWTPLVLLFFRRAIMRAGFRNEIATAISMTLSFLAGGIEIVYGNFFLLLLVLFFSPYSSSRALPDSLLPPPFIKGGRGGFHVLLHRMGSLSLVTLLFLFLSAIQLVPFLELWIHSIRGSGLTFKEATIWSFAPGDFLLFFLPDAYGYFLDMKKYWVNQCWFKTLYTGGLPFLLTFVFFTLGKGRKVLLAVMAFSLFLALGQYNPLYQHVFRYVPFFGGIRYPAKFLYLFILAISIASGLGFQSLVELSAERRRRFLKHLFMLFSLASGLFLLFLVLFHQGVFGMLKEWGWDFPNANPLPVNLYHAKRFFFYLCLFSLLMRVGVEVGWKTWVKVLLLFFLAADLFGNMGFYGKEKTSDYFRKTEIQERISSGPGYFRAFSTRKTTSMETEILIPDPSGLNLLKERHIPSLNMLHGVHDSWGIDVIRERRTDDLYRAFTGAPSITATPLLDVYGISHVVSVTPIEKDPRFDLVYSHLEGLQGKSEDLLKENTIKLYRYTNPSPRGRLLTDFKVMPSEQILSTMTTIEFQPHRTVLLEENPEWRAEGKSANSPAGVQSSAMGSNGVRVVSQKHHRLNLEVETSEDALLVLNDTFFPGWKVRVDGNAEKILRANYQFRAVAVPSGSHRVEFVYDPLSFKLGILGTLAGVIGCVILVRTRRQLRPA